MRLLTRRIGPCDHRPRLPHPEAKLPEKSLTLAHPQIDPETFPEEGRQRLPVPKVDAQPGVPGPLPQGRVDLRNLPVGEPRRSARPLSFDKPREPLLLESSNPLLHGSWSVSQQAGDLRARHPLGHQENAVEPVIVARVP